MADVVKQVGQHLLGLDIGEKRIGVALASIESLLASPLITLDNNAQLLNKLSQLIKEYSVKRIVIGLPRNLSGAPTAQSRKIKEIGLSLAKDLKTEIAFADETLSSVRAKEELVSRGKIFKRADIDKLAACLILEDYITNEYLK